MAGIAPPNMQAPPDAAEEDEDLSNVSPEEQAAYTDLVVTAKELLYSGGKVRPEILAMLDEDPSDLKEVLGASAEVWEQPSPDDPNKTVWQAQQPLFALAATCVVVLLEAVQKTGIMEKAPEDAGSIILHAGQEVMEDIAELAQRVGLYDYSEAELAEAFRKGADLYRDAAAEAGLVNMDEAAGEFEQITNASREGRTDELLPGLEEAAAQGGAQ